MSLSALKLVIIIVFILRLLFSMFLGGTRGLKTDRNLNDLCRAGSKVPVLQRNSEKYKFLKALLCVVCLKMCVFIICEPYFL